MSDPLRRRLVRACPRAAVLVAVLICLHVTQAGMLEENVRFSRISLDDGLSQSTVNCITQDEQGMMWFGTQDGLNRFDGYSFNVFKHDPLRPESLTHNFIWALHRARDGRLWIGTEGGGLDRWNPTDDSFEHYRHDPDDQQSLGNDIIRSIAEDHDGRLWIGTVQGVSRLHPGTGTFRNYRHDETAPASLGHDQVRCVFVDSTGRVWIGTEGGGLDRWDPDTEGFVHHRHDPADPASLGNDRVRTIHEDRNGYLWVGTYEGGVSRMDPETGRFTVYRHDPERPASLSHDRVRTVFQDSEGNLWVGTDSGLNRWLPDSAKFVVYRNDPADPYSISDDRVLSVFQDRGGLLWVATQAGLNRWTPELGSFTHYKQDANAESTLSSNLITALSTDRTGTVWIGSYGGGLDALDRGARTVTHHRHDPGDPHSLSDNRVMSLLHDGHGDLWVGTLEGGLNRMADGTRKFRVYRHDPNDEHSLSANGVTTIHEDGDGRLWVGTYRGGLHRLDRETGKFRRYRHDPENPTSLSRDRVMTVGSDRGGFVWVGTAGGGLNRLDPHTGHFDHFRHDPSDPTSLSSDVVWAIHEDRDGVLWIGTQGAGLNRWEPEDRAQLNDVFRVYTERDGLPNANIYGILEDDEGNLWLSSNKGLSRFDPSTETFINYDTTHGLQSNEFNFGAHHRSPDGAMFFGGTNGFNLFHPDEIQQNTHIPPVLLTGIQKMNEPLVADRPVWELDRIVLGHRDHVVSFDFAALDFAAPRKNRYAYMLEGFDKEWNDLGNLRRATYTNLDAGDYVFRVKGSNNDGYWNEQGASLKVNVLPPPWRTWWAYTLYGLALIGIFLAYARVQALKLHREEEYSRKLEQEVRDRTEEIAQRNHELADANRKLEQASLTDSLTGLRNRRYLMSYLQQDIAVVEREYRNKKLQGGGPPPAHCDFLFLMIDLDGFKKVNDTFGHEAGDRVLIEVCSALERTCRKSDTVIRWGGDEFLVVGRNVNREAAEILAGRILKAVSSARTEVAPGQTAGVGCSLGFSFYPFYPERPTAISWERVLMLADRALYIAKDSGRNGWVGITGATGTDDPNLVQKVIDSPGGMFREGAIAIQSSREVGELSLDGEPHSAQNAEQKTNARSA